MIHRALERKYTRIALGGESDSSVLKGHRRTYIGSYPGKIIQSLKECGTENCVILLDEVLLILYIVRGLILNLNENRLTSWEDHRIMAIHKAICWRYWILHKIMLLLIII